MADREADLDRFRADAIQPMIAGRKGGVGEAMEETRIDALVGLELDLDAASGSASFAARPNGSRRASGRCRRR